MNQGMNGGELGSDLPPQGSAAYAQALTAQDRGRPIALFVYGLYLLSLPSFGTLGLVGLALAYVMKNEASPWVRTHFLRQIALFWKLILVMILMILGSVMSLAMPGLLIVMIPVWLIVLALGGVLMTVWIYVDSGLGLMRLLDNRPAEG